MCRCSQFCTLLVLLFMVNRYKIIITVTILQLKCGCIFRKFHFITNFPHNVPVKFFSKIGQYFATMWTEVCDLLFWATLYMRSDTLITFYRAMLRRARYGYGKLSVCPSVTLRYCDYIGWNSSKIISPLVSLIFALRRPQHPGPSPRGTP